LSFKVQVGPPQIAIHQGQTVLVTGLDGQIAWPSEKGLYFLDTRIISNWAIYANGEPWELLNGGPINYYSARIFLTNKSILTEDGPIPPRTLGLTVSRTAPVGLEGDLGDLAGVGPGGGDALGAPRAAAVEQHHAGMLGVNLVEPVPDRAMVVEVETAREGDLGAGRQQHLGLAAALGGNEVAAVDHRRCESAMVDHRSGARAPG
jgi:hypothetical protein